MAQDFIAVRPLEADAPRIAEIHLAAMGSNPLLHAQFPTPDSLGQLRRFLEAYTASQLRDAASGVLVAREADTGLIAAFAKWDSPSHPEDGKLESGDIRYVEGCRPEFLDGYASLAEEARQRSFGDRPCYRRCSPRIADYSKSTCHVDWVPSASFGRSSGIAGPRIADPSGRGRERSQPASRRARPEDPGTR